MNRIDDEKEEQQQIETRSERSAMVTSFKLNSVEKLAMKKKQRRNN